MEFLPSNRKPRIAILGGGFGGLYTALALYWGGACLSADITLIDREPRFLFTPLLYELLTGEVAEWQISPEFRELLPTPIEFLQAEAEAVDLEANKIRFSNARPFVFDILVIALGSETAHFDTPGAGEHSLSFRTIDDAVALGRRLEATASGDAGPISIIGAGPSGVELATKIADFLKDRPGHRKTEVRLLDRSSEILPGYAAELRGLAMERLSAQKVELRLGSAIKSITGDGIELETGQKLPSGLNVWAAGTSPSPVLRNLGCLLDRRGRIPVGRTLQVPGHPGVFVLGDSANVGDGVPSTAQVAVRQAEVVAANVLALTTGRGKREYRHTPLGEMLSLGRGVAAANLFGVKFDGSTGNLVRKFIYLLSLPSPAHALRVGVSWAGDVVNDLARSFSK